MASTETPLMAFTRHCEALAALEATSGHAQDHRMLLKTREETHRAALKLAHEASSDASLDWIRIALRSGSTEIMQALPLQPLESLTGVDQSDLHSLAIQASPEFLSACLDRGLDLGPEFKTLVWRAMDNGDTAIQSLILQRAEWQQFLLRHVLRRDIDLLAEHADFVAHYVTQVVRTEPKYANLLLALSMAPLRPHVALILLSAGAEFARPHVNIFHSWINNHQKIRYFRYGKDIASLCRDQALLHEVQRAFC